MNLYGITITFFLKLVYTDIYILFIYIVFLYTFQFFNLVYPLYIKKINI